MADAIVEYNTLQQRATEGRSGADVALLAFMRTHKLVNPTLVLKYGTVALTKKQRSLGNDVYNVLEQVFFAALDVGAIDWADYCLQKLKGRFSSSLRVQRLVGMRQEAVGNWQDANAVYSQILESNPEDVASRKRMIAVMKGQKRIPEAIDECNKYLEIFQTDGEVWQELAELYIAEGALTKALFPYEECVLGNPRNMYAILSYAELQMSTGDMENARKYYAFALHLDESNVRALWGYALCMRANLANKKVADSLLLTQLFSQTVAKLIDVYNKAGNSAQATAAKLVLQSEAFTYTPTPDK
mmetsp:Transcript_38182/g.91759  ORF Transcript_38182/g.91759 Transcript_38182/m.91759 type:complete len:301 (+) Transcript_38182:83-985(+)